jgi:hypothetical protein
MAAPASAKAELAAIIDAMTTEEAERLLDYLHMLADPDELTPEEEAEVLKAMAEYEAGETVSGDEIKRKYGIGTPA